jgi:predicted HTH transcriptional regulator
MQLHMTTTTFKEELQQILQEGEGQEIEFKESLASLDKEMVALANASGGRIFLGITDGRKIKGGKDLQPAQVSGSGRCKQL